MRFKHLCIVCIKLVMVGQWLCLSCTLGSVIHTGILDIPVLYLCFGLLSYLALLWLNLYTKEVENLN